MNYERHISFLVPQVDDIWKISLLTFGPRQGQVKPRTITVIVTDHIQILERMSHTQVAQGLSECVQSVVREVSFW